ncbi:hypothetical protein EXU30_00025 [Shewanella maritima]|uniref:Uncharacterized protein n=1 Tax=Shewanella maritima TaxID=2520507 RepID=A0A411PCK0_9GAMM|nr:hypothetical protein [Shewanella maritima]QBF81256.1 hypothetical protein EXU30_00025 [Shewanella maritima]
MMLITTPNHVEHLGRKAMGKISSKVTKPFYKQKANVYIEMGHWHLERGEVDTAQRCFEVANTYHRLIVQHVQSDAVLEA